MNNKFLDGIKFGLGILLIFSIIGIVSAVGFHYADEILPGTFTGDYTFDGNTNFTDNAIFKKNITAKGIYIQGNDVWHEGNDGSGSGLDADTLDGQQGTYYQARVSSSCSAGSSIRAIAADGTVTCEADNTGSTSCSGWSGWKFPAVPGGCPYGCKPGHQTIDFYCSGGKVTSSRLGCSDCDQRNSCFAAGTSVLMRDGSYKLIEDVKVGDELKSKDGYNTVVAFDRPLLTYKKDQRLMSINEGDYFITDNHPVMTTQGWKSYYPESAQTEAWDILHNNISLLEIGDEIILSNNSTLLVKNLELKEKTITPQKLYNFVLDGDNTYYANDMLVLGFVPDKAGRFPIENEH